LNYIEGVLSRELKELEPTLDLFDSDRKILQVAHEDFANYLKFSSVSTEVGTGSLMEGTDYSIEEKEELESFLTVWTSMWLNKWKSRVRLLLGNERQERISRVSETLSKAEPMWKELKCREEMIEIVVSALIKNAEICGTKVLAENLLKTELAKRQNMDVNSPGHLIGFLSDALRRTREMARSAGPLIFIRVDKGYFSRQVVKKNPECEVRGTVDQI
jgi:hypothetical protein